MHQVATVPLVCLFAAGAAVTTYLALAILEVHHHATSAAQSLEASQAVKLLLTRSLCCAAMPHHVRRPFKPSFVLQESSPTPIFGSASTFGGGSGFGGFSGVAAGQSSGGRCDFDVESARQHRVHMAGHMCRRTFDQSVDAASVQALAAAAQRRERRLGRRGRRMVAGVTRRSAPRSSSPWCSSTRWRCR